MAVYKVYRNQVFTESRDGHIINTYKCTFLIASAINMTFELNIKNRFITFKVCFKCGSVTQEITF